MKDLHYKRPAELIQADLKRLKMTQRALADLLGIDFATVSRIVNGKQAMTVQRSKALAAITGRNGREYFMAQAHLWYDTDAEGSAMTKAGKKQ